MKTNHMRYILLAITALLSLTACEIESHSNGKLDGFWHLERVDTIATGGIADMSSDLIFWAVQSKLVEMGNRAANATDANKYIFRFSHAGGKLSLSEGRLSNRIYGDPLLEDVAPLRPFGISQLNEVFDVDALTGSKMILRSATLRLTFRKF